MEHEKLSLENIPDMAPASSRTSSGFLRYHSWLPDPLPSRNLDGSRVEESVLVTIDEVKPRDWAESVYQPDVVNNSEKLYKKLGYTM